MSTSRSRESFPARHISGLPLDNIRASGLLRIGRRGSSLVGGLADDLRDLGDRDLDVVVAVVTRPAREDWPK